MAYNGINTYMECFRHKEIYLMNQHRRNHHFSYLKWIVGNQLRPPSCHRPQWSQWLCPITGKNQSKFCHLPDSVLGRLFRKPKRNTRFSTIRGQELDHPRYQIREWILIRHPQKESGLNCKLSRPWYRPFRITGAEKTGVAAWRVYCSSKKNRSQFICNK